MLYITGITGHSGSWLLKRLNAEKYSGKIRCSMRQSKADTPEKYRMFEDCNLNIEFAIGHLEDEEFLRTSLAEVDTIIHTSGIMFSPKLVKAAIQNDVKWIISVHTTGRFSKYKSASEEYIQIEDEILSMRENINITVLRPTMIYGSSKDKNMYRLIGYLDKHLFFPLFGDGSNLMQPVHARDLGNAYYDVLIRPDITMNKEYNLSGKRPISYLDIIKIIKNYLGSNIKIIPLPISLSVFAAKIYNALFKNAIITVEQVLRMQENKDFDHEMGAKDFGYNPLSFEEGIKGEVEEYLGGVRADYTNVRY